jgi:hypothetical protein
MRGHNSVVINLIFITWEYGILNLPVLYELEGEFKLWGNDFSNKKLQWLAKWMTRTHPSSNVINGYSSLIRNTVHAKYGRWRQPTKNIVTLLSSKFPKWHCPVVGLAI